MTADAILNAARGHLEDRAEQYDQPEGERSMRRAVAAFNALTERDLTESEGWLFMAQLKMARGTGGGMISSDTPEDGAAYVALWGEAALRGR